MDLATLIGLLGVIGVLVGAVVSSGAGAGDFINTPSILIVMGGTFMATLIKFPLATLLGSFKVGLKTLMGKMDKPEDLITESVELATVARKQGLLALDGKEMSNPFLELGVQLLVDGNDSDVVRSILNNEIDQMIERHERGEAIFRSIGDVAPAMGMIGTLVGLIQMLSNMNDPKSIGPAMAVALLTTLYGAIIANAFALPLADKLAARSGIERTNKQLVLESINSIQAGINPRIMKEILVTYLPANRREFDEDESAK